MKLLVLAIALFYLGVLPATASQKDVPASYGNRQIASCKNLGTGDESCKWSYYYKNTCNGKKCSKLLIYFAGGQMTCSDPTIHPQNFLSRYAENGYVAVCAQIFETEPTSGLYPFYKEAPRVDQLMKTITSDPVITQAWNGEKLLISGVSHGSAATVIAMARGHYDKNWLASKTTGACFFDGVYDARDNLQRAFDNTCTIYQRAYTRYSKNWSGYRNYPATWPTPDTCENREMDMDSVSGINASNFAIKNWKIVQCGSSLNYCDKDLVAAAPQWQLCKSINSDPAKSCRFASFSTESHNECGATIPTMDACRSWFDELAVRPDSDHLSFGQACPANSTCTYEGYRVENKDSAMACAEGQSLSVIKSSYWGDHQKPYESWSSCYSYLQNQCEKVSSCKVNFNNLWCGGDPEMNEPKNATVVVSCSPGPTSGSESYGALPNGVIVSSGSINQLSPYLTSESTSHFLELERNGDVVVSAQAFLGKRQFTKKLWENDVNVNSHRLPFLKLGSNGVLYELGKYGAVIWQSDNWATTSGGAGMVMQNDGNLVIYDLKGNALWASGTGK